MSALDVQVGANHYKNRKIQPIEYIYHNNLGFIEGCIVKYITRYKDKGKIDDLHKIIHYVQILIELEYGDKTNGKESEGENKRAS